MQKRIGKVVIVNQRKEVLLLKRGASAPNRALTWETPGGIVEKGETVEAGALRETFEESGIQLDDARPVLAKKMSWGNHWTFFFATVYNPTVKISWEHQEYLWQPIDKLDQLKDLPAFYLEDLQNILHRVGLL